MSLGGATVLDQAFDLGGMRVFNPGAPSQPTDVVRLQDLPAIGADALGWYVVTKAAHAPANAVNLGGLPSGFVKSSQTGGVATISIDTSTYLTTTAAASTYQLALAPANTTIKFPTSATIAVDRLSNAFIAKGTADAQLTGAFFLGSLPTGLLKVATTTGALSTAAANTDFADPTAFYVVTKSANAPSNAVNLGGMAAGPLQQTVSGGVATVAPLTMTQGAIPFGAANGTQTFDAANLFWDLTNLRLGVRNGAPAAQVHLVDQAAANDRGILLGGHGTAAQVIAFKRSEGTLASPTTVSNTDYLGVLQQFAHDGTSYLQTGEMGFRVRPGTTVATGAIATDWYVDVASSGATGAYELTGHNLALRVTRSGSTTNSGRVAINVNPVTTPTLAAALTLGIAGNGAVALDVVNTSATAYSSMRWLNNGVVSNSLAVSQAGGGSQVTWWQGNPNSGNPTLYLFSESSGTTSGARADLGAFGGLGMLIGDNAPFNGSAHGTLEITAKTGTSTQTAIALTAAFRQDVLKTNGALGLGTGDANAFGLETAGATRITIGATGTITLNTLATAGWVKTDASGNLSIDTVGSGANSLGYYLVTQSANAPANAINLGALSSGMLSIAVSGAVAAFSSTSAPAGAIAFGAASGGALTYDANDLFFDATNKTLWLSKTGGSNTGAPLRISGIETSDHSSILLDFAGNQAITKAGGSGNLTIQNNNGAISFSTSNGTNFPALTIDPAVNGYALSALATDGFVKTSGGAGGLVVDTTAYLSTAYTTVSSAGTARTARTKLNFSSAFTAVDNAGATRTDVDLAATLAGVTTVTNANLTIGADGRITSASNGSSGGTGADALGTYFVASSSHAPANAVNLGGLSTGFLKLTVSGAVATPSIDPNTYLTSAYANVQQNSAAVTQRNTLNFTSRLSASDVSGKTQVDLAASGVSVGTFTNATVATDLYGRVVSILSGATPADGGAYYVVTRSTSAPPNSTNLGGMGSGFLKSSVSGGISTVSIDTTTYQPLLSLSTNGVLFANGGSSVTTDVSNFSYNSTTHTLSVTNAIAQQLSGSGSSLSIQDIAGVSPNTFVVLSNTAVSVQGNLLPNTSRNYNLGSAIHVWETAYITTIHGSAGGLFLDAGAGSAVQITGGQVFIQGGSNNDVEVSTTGTGNLTLQAGTNGNIIWGNYDVGSKPVSFSASNGPNGMSLGTIIGWARMSIGGQTGWTPVVG